MICAGHRVRICSTNQMQAKHVMMTAILQWTITIKLHKDLIEQPPKMCRPNATTAGHLRQPCHSFQN